MALYPRNTFVVPDYISIIDILSIKISAMDKNKQIGGRIRKLRKENALNQRDFAASIGISQNFLSQIENSGCEPTKPLLISIEYKYGIDLKKHPAGKNHTEKKELISEDILSYEKNDKEFFEIIKKFKLVYKHGGKKWDVLRKVVDLCLP